MLEVVEVEHEERDAFFKAARTFQCGLQVVVQKRAGGKACKGVVEGHVAVEFTAFAEFAGFLVDSASEH